MDIWIDAVMVIWTSFVQGIEKNKNKGGLILFMTYIRVFFVRVLQIVTNHLFIYIYMLTNHWTSV